VLLNLKVKSLPKAPRRPQKKIAVKAKKVVAKIVAKKPASAKSAKVKLTDSLTASLHESAELLKNTKGALKQVWTDEGNKIAEQVAQAVAAGSNFKKKTMNTVGKVAEKVGIAIATDAHALQESTEQADDETNKTSGNTPS